MNLFLIFVYEYFVNINVIKFQNRFFEQISKF